MESRFFVDSSVMDRLTNPQLLVYGFAVSKVLLELGNMTFHLNKQKQKHFFRACEDVGI